MLGAVVVLGACRSEPKTIRASGDEKSERVQVTPTWSIVIPQTFKQLDHGTDWQAYDDHRVVFLKAQLATAPEGGPSSLSDLATMSSEWLRGAPGERIEHSTGSFRGEAVTRATATGFELKGYMAKDGNVVVCLIDFDNERYKSWAAETWRSLGAERAR